MAESKRDQIKQHCLDMLKESYENMITKVDKALNSGAIDIEAWDPVHSSMIIPKCIVIAILENEAEQYDGRGTSFERRVRREVRNIRYFI